MADPAVVIDGLEKRYGDVRALDGVDLTVERGEIFGLVGPNGAGKSTTLRIVSTLLSADAGSVTVYGADRTQRPNAVRESIRYVPEEAGAYENQTGRQYLAFIAGFYADDPDPMVRRGVEMAELGERIDDKTGEYSKGMTRKLLLAAALMTDPDLAILDEPTSGLDVRNARQVRETIESYPGADRSVILSSHDMLEVAYLCDRVGLLHDGHVVETGAPVTEGETVTTTVTVTNDGNASGQQTITLSVDGSMVDLTTVSLDAGASTDVSLLWATEASDAGDPTLTVASANDSASTTVSVENADTGDDSTTDDSTPTEDTPADTATPEGTTEPTESGQSGPGFGVVARTPEESLPAGATVVATERIEGDRMGNVGWSV